MFRNHNRVNGLVALTRIGSQIIINNRIQVIHSFHCTLGATDNQYMTKADGTLSLSFVPSSGDFSMFTYLISTKHFDVLIDHSN